MSELVHNPSFWVAVSFVVFMLIAVKYRLHKKFVHHLDGHREVIRMELDAARKLREEAEAVLADYKVKQAAHMKEAEAMLAHAKQEADALRANAEKELMASLDARMKAAIERIEQMEAQALSDVRDHVVDITIAAAKDMIADHFNSLSSEQMVQSVIADLERKVH